VSDPDRTLKDMSQRTICDGCSLPIEGPPVTLEWGLGHSSLRVDLCRGPQGEPRGGCASRVLRAIAQTSPGIRTAIEASIDREDDQRADAEIRARDRARRARHDLDRLKVDRQEARQEAFGPLDPHNLIGPW
jgi:hypothetical protein